MFLISPTTFSLAELSNYQFHSPVLQKNGRTQKICFVPKVYCSMSDEIASEEMIPLPPNVKAITSTSNHFVKHCVKLRQSSSYRHLQGSVVVVGATLVREIASFHKTRQDRPVIECLLILNDYRIPEELDDPSIHIVHVNSAVMRKLSGVQSIDSIEVIALVRMPSTFHVVNDVIHEEDCREWFSFHHRVLVLDGIQDPGNLGTLLRSATAFRWDGAFLLPGCCDPFNDKALRASRGACFQIQIVTGNWTHVEALRKVFRMKMLAGHPATNGKLNHVSSLSVDLADSLAESPLCLVLGSEGGGLSEFSQNACELVTIQMAGDFESLNVSVAGGIFMYMLQPKKNSMISASQQCHNE